MKLKAVHELSVIQLRINEEVLKKHEKFIFESNSKKKGRIVQKLSSLNENERNKFAGNVYRFILNNLRDIVLGEIEALSRIKRIYSYLVNSIPNKLLGKESKLNSRFFNRNTRIFIDLQEECLPISKSSKCYNMSLLRYSVHFYL